MTENTPKLITFSDIPDESPAERKARIEKMKRKYRQMMEIICPSKDIRAFAKRFAKRKYPCDKCAYRKDYACMVPYSDGYMEEMEIDPCYEGILVFLREEMGDSSDCGAMMKLRDELDETNDELCAVLESTIAVADSFSFFMECKPDMQMLIIALTNKMRDSAQVLLKEALSRRGNIEPKNGVDERGTAMT